MKEKREIINQIAQLLTYKIRAGELTSEGGDKIWRIALKDENKVDRIMDILDMELPEDDTLNRIERL
jgi:hypothetical protein